MNRASQAAAYEWLAHYFHDSLQTLHEDAKFFPPMICFSLALFLLPQNFCCVHLFATSRASTF